MDPLERAKLDNRRSAGGGFPTLLTAGVCWILAGASTFVLSPGAAALVTVCQGFVSMPIGLLLLPKLLRYPKGNPDNPLTPLAILIAVSQSLAFPAFILPLGPMPHYVPAIFASVVAAHFLPFSWLMGMKLYAVLAGVLSMSSYGIAITLRQGSLHVVAFVVGAVLVIGAFVARAHVAEEEARVGYAG